MQDTETGTSNADISGSTRAIEVSFAQRLFTKHPASNEIIKRGVLDKRTPNLKEFLLWDNGNMVNFNFKVN
ncbi:hypothetical protein TYRP_021770 [Tyrophagus putrescentiae]|nr:hypothetical protein TYRP_021770 [Tyrophagus putrescentiae]